MCGIVGYTGRREALSVLVPALRRLEYRGYDSAGVATLNGHGLELCKSVGKISSLEAALASSPPGGNVGIAHTRWATHGRPSEANAHPHVDCSGRIAIVHNGIIENYAELRRDLAEEGHRFRSGTDSEVIAHLIERFHTGDLLEAVRRAISLLRGGFAAACIAQDRPDTVIAFRSGGTPLVVGRKAGESFLASDVPALLGETDEILVLEDNELAVLTPGEVTVGTADGRTVRRETSAVSWSVEDAEKGGYPHLGRSD